MIHRALATVLLCLFGAGPTQANEQLEESWEEFMRGLAQAQASLTDPAAFPPKPTDRGARRARAAPCAIATCSPTSTA